MQRTHAHTSTHSLVLFFSCPTLQPVSEPPPVPYTPHALPAVGPPITEVASVILIHLALFSTPRHYFWSLADNTRLVPLTTLRSATSALFPLRWFFDVLILPMAQAFGVYAMDLNTILIDETFRSPTLNVRETTMKFGDRSHSS